MGYQIKRVDANQKEIIATVREMGVSVLILSEVGRGCPDILLGLFGQNHLVEIKDGQKPPSARKLTSDEQKFFDTWKGQVCIISSVEEAIALVNRIRQDHGRQ